MQSVIVMFFALGLASVSPVHALLIGSDSKVSRESWAFFPKTENSTNEILGFASMAGGFQLENLVTTCSFNDFLPVSGPVTLNGGTLTLLEDLFFIDGISIANAGIINAQNHTILFPASNLLKIPTNQASKPYLVEIVEKTLTNPIYSVDWSPDDKYIAAGLKNGEIDIYQFTGMDLVFTTSINVGTSGQLGDLLWRPVGPVGSDYYLVVGINSVFRVYDFNSMTSTLTLNASADQSSSVSVHACPWDPTGNYIALYRQPTAGSVALYKFTPGSLSLEALDKSIDNNTDNSYQVVSWNKAGNYFMVGTGFPSGSNALYAYSFKAPSTLIMQKSQSFSNQLSYVSWSPASSFLAVGLYGGSQTLQIWKYDSVSNTFSAQLAPTQSQLVQNCEWSYSGTSLSVGLDVLAGSPEMIVYAFDPVAISLSLPYGPGVIASGNVYRTRWSHDNCKIVRGDAANTLGVYTICPNIPYPNELIFNNAQILFNSPVLFQAPVRFVGQNLIDAQGNTLDLGTVGIFKIDTNSSLLIKNAIIKNITGSNVICVDNTSTVSLSQVTWLQTTDFNFNLGSLNILGDTLMSGSKQFTFSSTGTTEIYQGATWKFDAGMTFNYAPTSGASNLLVFENSRASLYLSTATLYAPGPLQLTHGTLVLEGPCLLKSGASSATNGITIGDGISSANNMSLRILPESGPYIDEGYVVYENIN